MAESKSPPTIMITKSGVASLIEVLRGLDKSEDGSGNIILRSEFDAKELYFGFASASPVTIAGVIARERIRRVAVLITVPFDDPSSTLSVGHTGDPEALLARDDITPTELGLYEASPMIVYGGTDTIKLYINRAGSSQGAGYVLIDSDRNDL